MKNDITLQKKILGYAEKNKKFRTSDVLEDLKHQYSRPYISRTLGDMTSKKLLSRAGSGPRVFYALPKNEDFLSDRIRRRLKNTNLKEHEVVEKLMGQVPFLGNLKDNVRSVFDYAFSEMLNNAIEHSKSEWIEIEVRKDSNYLLFEVRDFGIGVYNNVMNERNLNSELEAIQDLLKGKVTTQPQSHSGEGIFFTSKSGDLYYLDSFGYRLLVNNEINDVFVEEINSIKGTRVIFKIKLNSPRHLNDIFNKYQSEPESYAFDKTEVLIKLYKMGTIHVSRSQARRVLSGLDKFKKVIFDFDSVPTVGQAFADEIFRVFAQNNPEMELTPINMNEAVEFMVKRVDSPK